MNSLSLLRYNFRVLMFGNWWLLVFPLAASQLTVFWNIITQRFYASLPARSVEMVTPLLAAFLSAHLLSAEYRAGMGAILATKPVHIGKVVLLRLAVVLGLVWTLAGLSLAAYYNGMEHYEYVRPALAGAASSLFLALLALTFATLLRHPLAGFGVAALYWAMDLPPGPAINPYLSLTSLSFSLLPPEPMTLNPLPGSWWAAKLALAAGALLLYFWHGRLLFTLGTPLTMRQRRKALALAGSLLAFYMVSGAAFKVGFGYANRGRLVPDDATWFRRQFASYGPLPVASLFGPAFFRYVGDIPNTWRIQQESETDRWGNTQRHRRELREVLDRMPGSLWAPSAAELLARLDVPQAAAYYEQIIRRYPGSPYLPFALDRLAHTYADAGNEKEARSAYERLLSRCPGSLYETEALRYLAESEQRRGNRTAAEQRTRQWIAAAPVQEKFVACLLLAQILLEQGRREEAGQAAEMALAGIKAFRRAVIDGTLAYAGGRVTKWEQDAVSTEVRALEIKAALNR
jgi:tetratricopeptide (TPR) repeat protein